MSENGCEDVRRVKPYCFGRDQLENRDCGRLKVILPRSSVVKKVSG